MDLFSPFKGPRTQKTEYGDTIFLETHTDTDSFDLLFTLRKVPRKLSPSLPDFSFAAAAGNIFKNADADIVRNGVLPPNSLVFSESYPEGENVLQLFLRELRSVCSVISTSICSVHMTSLTLEIGLHQNLPSLRASYVIRTINFCSGLKTLTIAFTNDFYISLLGSSEFGTSKLESLVLKEPSDGGKDSVKEQMVTFIVFFAAARRFKRLKELNLDFVDDVPSHDVAVLERLGIIGVAGVEDFWQSKLDDEKNILLRRSDEDFEGFFLIPESLSKE